MAEYRPPNRLNFNDQNDQMSVFTGQLPGRLNPGRLTF